MSINHYYMKFTENFFNMPEIQLLSGVANGDEYVLTYLKLATKSIRFDGFLKLNDKVDFTKEMLSSLFNKSTEFIDKAISFYERLGLIENISGTFFLRQISDFIGKNSSSTERVRKHRARKKKEEAKQKQLFKESKEESPVLETEVTPEIKPTQKIETVKADEMAITVPSEIKENKDSIQNQMQEAIKIYKYYVKRTDKKGNEHNATDIIYRCLNKHSLDEIMKSIDYYIDSLSNSKYSQLPDNFFSDKSGYIWGFLEKTEEEKLSLETKNKHSEADKKFEQLFIASEMLRVVYRKGKELEFYNFLKERTNWLTDVSFEEYPDVVRGRVLGVDRYAGRFLKQENLI